MPINIQAFWASNISKVIKEYSAYLWWKTGPGGVLRVPEWRTLEHGGWQFQDLPQEMVKLSADHEAAGVRHLREDICTEDTKHGMNVQRENPSDSSLIWISFLHLTLGLEFLFNVALHTIHVSVMLRELYTRPPNVPFPKWLQPLTRWKNDSRRMLLVTVR